MKGVIETTRADHAECNISQSPSLHSHCRPLRRRRWDSLRLVSSHFYARAFFLLLAHVNLLTGRAWITRNNCIPCNYASYTRGFLLSPITHTHTHIPIIRARRRRWFTAQDNYYYTAQQRRRRAKKQKLTSKSRSCCCCDGSPLPGFSSFRCTHTRAHQVFPCRSSLSSCHMVFSLSLSLSLSLSHARRTKREIERKKRARVRDTTAGRYSSSSHRNRMIIR